jgi:hypothetical protein
MDSVISAELVFLVLNPEIILPNRIHRQSSSLSSLRYAQPVFVPLWLNPSPRVFAFNLRCSAKSADRFHLCSLVSFAVNSLLKNAKKQRQ